MITFVPEQRAGRAAGEAAVRNTESLSITLPHDMAQMIKDKVASGAYASESEVVEEGLRALQTRDAAIEGWLHESVLPVYDRVANGDEKLVDADEVFTGVAARYRARNKTKTAR
jgi:antitoxin ParD1/3/4